MPDLNQCWPVTSLSLFGSVARGQATPASDLDVLVEFDRPIPLSAFLALEDRVAELAGWPVDLVSRGALKPFMVESILCHAVLV